MLFAIIGALIIGASLGLFGSGGSILTVPVLMYLVDLLPIAYRFFVAHCRRCISLFGSISYIRQKVCELETPLEYSVFLA